MFEQDFSHLITVTASYEDNLNGSIQYHFFKHNLHYIANDSLNVGFQLMSCLTKLSVKSHVLGGQWTDLDGFTPYMTCCNVLLFDLTATPFNSWFGSYPSTKCHIPKKDPFNIQCGVVKGSFMICFSLRTAIKF